MYFSGRLSVDPSQKTVIEKIKPTKVFRKFLHLLTVGGISDRQEQETFTAVAILQQFNMAFRALGISNLVRLARDDLDFYLDSEGKKGDLKESVEEFELETDAFDSEYFNSLFLVVEHEDENFKYLIEVKISRIHTPGEHPISVNVNALLRDFKSGPNDDARAVKSRMEKIFASQASYDSFLREKRSSFEAFISSLELEIKKFIHTDEIVNDTRTKIIRPKEPVTSRAEIRHTSHGDPVYYGYYGGDDYLFYTLMWSSMCHDHHVYCNHIHVVDDHGAEIMAVGEQGFDAGESNALNPGEDFEVPEGADTTLQEGSQFDCDIADHRVETSSGGMSDGDSGGSWFDSVGGGDSGGDVSSCSSCSSCGGD